MLLHCSSNRMSQTEKRFYCIRFLTGQTLFFSILSASFTDLSCSTLVSRQFAKDLLSRGWIPWCGCSGAAGLTRAMPCIRVLADARRPLPRRMRLLRRRSGSHRPAEQHAPRAAWRAARLVAPRPSSDSSCLGGMDLSSRVS